MNKVVLSGYYGFNNAGDEAVLFAIIQSLKKEKKDLDITILSNNPQLTAKQYDVKAVNRWKLSQVTKAIKDCHLLISGGGSLLQDVTSKNSILYYLAIILLAKLFRKPVVIYAQGIGPINFKRNQLLTRVLLNFTQGITVRDEKSREDLSAMGVKREIKISADPVLSFTPADIDRDKGVELLKRGGVDVDKGRILGVSIRPWNTDTKNFLEIAQACDRLSCAGWQIVFIPMHFPDDIATAREVSKDMKEKAYLLKENYSPYETMCIYKGVDMVLGMRLHSLIMAAVVEKPLVAISYDPKINRFANLLEISDQLDINNLKCQDILDLVHITWQNKDDFVKKLQGRMKLLREKSLLPAKIVSGILGQNNKNGR